MTERLTLLGIVLSAGSGLPGLVLSRYRPVGQWISLLLAGVGAVAGLAGVGVYWATGDNRPIELPWPLPGAELHVAVDGLSAVFLAPIFLVALLGQIYGLAYWSQVDHPQNGRKLRLFYGLATAGMALLVVARNGILFLFGWEIMALAAYFLVTTEDDDREVRETGWIYLIATHTATLCLFALFILLRRAAGSFTLQPLEPGRLSPGSATAVVVLALVGFGLKAGIMPLHVWLPSAHALAPSHVSALMSGVILKMGVYGLVRVTSLIPDLPVEWGLVILALGIVSGVLGVAFAIGQHDLKRLLAYHSIENIGIMVMGLGLALVGRATGRWDWVALGLAGGLLHVWNHALFKALLFLSAGSVIHATHTREIDQLGGLSRRMPRTALYFLVGAVAICGLPPLNGFVSEFLVYLGLFRTLTASPGGGTWPGVVGAAFAVPALALIGALALACFVKVFGAVFLGSPRSNRVASAHESPVAMTGPMLVLVGCCVFIGLAPLWIAPVFDRAVAAWVGTSHGTVPQLVDQAPMDWISVMAVVLLGGLIAAGGLLWWRLQRTDVAAGPTWGCGYVAPTPRMQYTASSFGQMLVGLFAWALRPHTKQPHDLPLFPAASRFHSDVPDPVLDEAVRPTFRLAAWALSGFRVVQRGSAQAYLLYIVLALIVLFAWPR
jgi:hydrogenase-4 component B